MAGTPNNSPVRAFARLLEVLDRMEIRYEVGGSTASSVHGLPRTTLDVDLVVDMRPNQIDAFAAELRDEFYVDASEEHAQVRPPNPAERGSPLLSGAAPGGPCASGIREAFARSRAANLIHLGTAWKFDLFPLREDEYSRVEFGRRVFREIRPDGGEAIECAVASAEDTILRKLEWYKAGGEASERQWNDLRGVCRTAGGSLDVAYLRRWAGYLEVADLLESLLVECGL
jgi:hypothetical protein